MSHARGIRPCISIFQGKRELWRTAVDNLRSILTPNEKTLLKTGWRTCGQQCVQPGAYPTKTQKWRVGKAAMMFRGPKKQPPTRESGMYSQNDAEALQGLFDWRYFQLEIVLEFPFLLRWTRPS